MPLQQIASLSTEQLAQLHALYQREWWSKDRTLADVETALENSSLVFGFVTDAGKLVAFCRVLTDFTFHAILYDVIVEESWRKKGLGARLMNAVLDDPPLQNVNAVCLCCREEMLPFYRKWGFELFDAEFHWMVKPRPDAPAR